MNRGRDRVGEAENLSSNFYSMGAILLLRGLGSPSGGRTGGGAHDHAYARAGNERGKRNFLGGR